MRQIWRLIVGGLIMAFVAVSGGAVWGARLPAAAPVPSPLQAGDENWRAGLGLAGFNNVVNDLEIAADGTIYAGGEFVSADGTLANHVARWDGAAWQALGGGIDRKVSVVAPGANGVLYAAAEQWIEDIINHSWVMRWDGAAWQDISGEIGEIKAMAVGRDGSLYIGGESMLRRWDGAAWQSYALSGTVYAIAAGPGGNLYVAGSFGAIGGAATGNVARWDGTAWHALGEGLSGFASALSVASDGTLYAAIFTTVDGIPTVGVARWDGAAWHAIANPLTGDADPIDSMAAAPDGSLYVVWPMYDGELGFKAHIRRWDGAAWSIVAGRMDNLITSLAVDAAGTLYAGGDFTSIDGAHALRLARRVGDTWRAVGGAEGSMGVSSRVFAMVAGPGRDVYIGGRFDWAGEVRVNNVARWDGAAWHALGDGLPGFVSALALGPDGTLYAVGTFPQLNHGFWEVARWDGAAWHEVGNGPYIWEDVAAVGQDGTLYAGGALSPYLKRWNGTEWQDFGTLNGSVNALLIAPDGDLYVGGRFDNAGVLANNIARWDGTAWHNLGAGVNGEVNALAFGPDGSIYAAGYFHSAGGGVAGTSYLARWDGSAWSSVGGGVNYYVYALAVGSDGSVYAGSEYPLRWDDASVGLLARWDGARWHGLGSSVDSKVNQLAVGPDGTLSAGGWFGRAGERASSHFAQWTVPAGTCDLAGDVALYPGNRPVGVRLTTPGDAACLTVGRADQSHPDAPAAIQTGFYWDIRVTTAAGAPASGFALDLTLPTPGGADTGDQACQFDGANWDCAAGAHGPTSVTRANVTSSGVWAVSDEAAVDAHRVLLPLLNR